MTSEFVIDRNIWSSNIDVVGKKFGCRIISYFYKTNEKFFCLYDPAKCDDCPYDPPDTVEAVEVFYTYVMKGGHDCQTVT